MARVWRSDGTPDGEPLRGHEGEVYGALVLPDGWISSWSRDKTRGLWCLESRADGGSTRTSD
jgi:hypothetical protein